MITDEERFNYLSVVGNRGSNILGLITAMRPFIEAMETEIGKELLSDDIAEHAKLMNKIFDSLVKDGKAEQADVILLKLLDSRLKKIHDRLANYNKSVEEVKNVTKLKRRLAQ